MSNQNSAMVCANDASTKLRRDSLPIIKVGVAVEALHIADNYVLPQIAAVVLRDTRFKFSFPFRPRCDDFRRTEPPPPTSKRSQRILENGIKEAWSKVFNHLHVSQWLFSKRGASRLRRRGRGLLPSISPKVLELCRDQLGIS